MEKIYGSNYLVIPRHKFGERELERESHMQCKEQDQDHHPHSRRVWFVDEFPER